MIEINNLNLTLQHKHVLKNISLKLPLNGEIIGIMGPNGSGKSTLVKALVGELQYKGTITLNGKPLSHLKRHVAYVPQKMALDLDFPIDVESLVLSGCYGEIGWFKRVPQQKRQQCHLLLQELELFDLRKRPLHTLSGGQLQRVILARTLMRTHDVYILDEPFVGIDFKSEKMIIQKLNALKKEGKLIIIVHHDLSTASDYFDRVLLLNQSVQFFGPTKDVLVPSNIEQTFLASLHVNDAATLMNQRKEQSNNGIPTTSR
ncbi:metal ABC transporter ATP-binding protein [Staphylococcus hyicus]|uniref:metal ABC transporter ATP-binding protein n=1 Tax=Staphylococcus hyicus TaxID=1284 RepID=UPI00208F98E5|nr:metal ABC transporter ATP-binding protein [Staphylococcus hyicus]MCO4329051.1 metal ABC transporter ATP-binding protein [Staphylococcus hyicus]MCO4331624.1 metal ABC transporter ATP-binding protein [Staphylococcus hyicus]MCO4334833.1 metal ABC transporter ATP-binding protein [Staphylococcus hyicus]MCO4335414.1 metal ABC transporter ATP-binding protein [Staphylococcus hyicus]